MVGSLDDYLRGYSDRCQIGLAGDVVAVVAEGSGRNSYTGFLSDIENLSWRIFKAV